MPCGGELRRRRTRGTPGRGSSATNVVRGRERRSARRPTRRRGRRRGRRRRRSRRRCRRTRAIASNSPCAAYSSITRQPGDRARRVGEVVRDDLVLVERGDRDASPSTARCSARCGRPRSTSRSATSTAAAASVRSSVMAAEPTDGSRPDPTAPERRRRAVAGVGRRSTVGAVVVGGGSVGWVVVVGRRLVDRRRRRGGRGPRAARARAPTSCDRR